MNQIYKIVNQVNNKVYIGLTTQGVRCRWSEHLYRFNSCERDHKLYQAMRKYGVENFRLEVICFALQSDYLKSLEVEFIKKYDSFNNGYNMTCGGEFISSETRKKLSEIFTGRKITWGQKIVDTKRKRFNTWPCGKVSGDKNKTSKTYTVKYPDGTVGMFKGLRSFCRKHNLSHNLLLATLTGKQTHHKEYVLLARLNDHPEREYTQVGGNGGYSVALTG